MNFAYARVKAWKGIWGAGQGVGNISDLPSTQALVPRLREEYAAARAKLLAPERVKVAT